MTNLNYIETLNLGCDPIDEHNIADTQIIRFCMSTVYAWGTLIPWLSDPFIKAQLLHQEGALDSPMNVSIIYPFELDHKRKDSDPETVYDRIKWIVANMRIPPCGIRVSFYQNLKSAHWITAPWAANQYWTMAKRHNPQGSYITIQRVEPLIGSPKASVILEEAPVYEAAVEKKARKMGYDVKYVDYTTPFEELYDLLLGSDHHFSYSGASMFFAAMIGLPTTAYCLGLTDQWWPGKYYNKVGTKVNVMVQRAKWALLQTNIARVMQWDPDEQMVLNKPPEYLTHIDSVEKIDHAFERILRCR